MAGVSLENWVERIRDPKIECMSRDEMADLQSRRLVDVVQVLIRGTFLEGLTLAIRN